MITLVEISPEPLVVGAHLASVAHPTVGATALFVGTVRDHDPEAAGTVVELEYSAHPDAPRMLRELIAEFDRPDLRIAIGHRVGSVRVGEPAIVCAVGSAHRAEAFEVSRAVVEAVKHRLPVWKRQLEADGTSSWKGIGG